MHAQDIKMLTVLEPCDDEYRVRVLLQLCGQRVTSLLIGDIRVPAAVSYLRFRSLFLIYSSLPPPLLVLLSLVVFCDAFPSFAFEVAVVCRSIPACCRRERAKSMREGEQRFAVCRVEPQLDIWGRPFIPSGTGMSLTGLILAQMP